MRLKGSKNWTQFPSRELAILSDREHETGSVTLHWNLADFSGRPLPNGVYVYRLTMAGLIHTCTVSLLN